MKIAHEGKRARNAEIQETLSKLDTLAIRQIERPTLHRQGFASGYCEQALDGGDWNAGVGCGVLPLKMHCGMRESRPPPAQPPPIPNIYWCKSDAMGAICCNMFVTTPAPGTSSISARTTPHATCAAAADRH